MSHQEVDGSGVNRLVMLCERCKSRDVSGAVN